MKKYPKTLIKEDSSVNAFRSLLEPWTLTKNERDIVVDYFVQPYESFPDKDGNLSLFPRMFRLQIKYSSNKPKDGVLKKAIEVADLLTWEKLSEHVMLAVYIQQEDKFFYEWVKGIEIKINQKSQTINLTKFINKENVDQEKKEILRYLEPPKMTEVLYIPRLKSEEETQGQIQGFHIHVSNIRDSSDIKQVTNQQIPNKIKELQVKRDITDLKVEIENEPNNPVYKFKLAIKYIALEKYEEALDELKILIEKFMLPHARVLFNIVRGNSRSILKGKKEYRFYYYIRWKDGTQDGTHLKIYIDEGIYYIPKTESMIIALPKQSFKKIYFHYPLSHIISYGFFITLLDEQGEPLYEFEEEIDMKTIQ